MCAAGSFYGNVEILPPEGTPVHYGVEGDEAGFSSEFYDPYTSADAIGSNAELGGDSAAVGNSDWENFNDADVVNLTGQTESPMTPSTTGPNLNGAGTAGQQIPSRHLAQTLSSALHSVMTGLVRQGGTVTAITQAPIPQSPTAPVTLVQSPVAGISLHGNLVLFFVVGAVVALILFPRFE
jgi:hypothetical protein